MHQIPADIEEKLVDFILANSQEPGTPSWTSGHDRPACEEDETASKSRFWLGSHKDMSSPGEITLYRDNLNSAFWSFIGSCSPDPAYYRDLCRSLIYMVLVHERFHHFCDVYGQITRYRGGDHHTRKNGWLWEREEALATTWEWQELQRSCSAFSKLPASLQMEWNEWWFEGITAPGYRDWKDYQHFCCFKDGLAQHLIASDAPVNDTTNAALIEWLYAQLLTQQWCDDAVIYRMEAHDGNTALSSPCFPPLHPPSYWIESGIKQPLCQQRRKSLQGVYKEIQSFNGVLCLNGNPISEALLGLLLIEGLQGISLTGLSGDLRKAIEIVNKYLPNGNGKPAVLDCQNDLLDADLDSFAHL